MQYALEPPFGMKVDTEGNELEVIRGASRFLLDTEFVIAEVSVAKRFEGSYLFEEFVLEMLKNGFYVFEFLTNRENVNTGTRFVDIAFLNSKFGDRR